MESREFQELVDQHYVNLYRFALSLAQNEQDAADLVQEAFSIFARKGHQIRDSSKVKSWLFTTLRREFFALRRDHQRYSDTPPDGETAAELTVEQAHSLDSEAVLNALRRLPLEYREPLTLYYLDDQSYQEIANILNIPIGTVMSRLSRAKEKIRVILSDEHRP